MRNGLAIVTVAVAASTLSAFQVAESVLHIKVVVVDAAQNPRPVPRHSILISDNPPSRPPRRIETGTDGMANVRLRPGNYTVESDVPFVFGGKSYEWTQSIDIVEGRDATLELSAENAEVRAADPASASSAATAEVTASSLLAEWKESVLALWTPTRHASGFLINAQGLIASNQRTIGSATTVEVQISETLKAAGQVVMANPDRDVAVIRINPALATELRPIPLPCVDGSNAPVARNQETVSIGVPLVEPEGAFFDLTLPEGSSGGPVFTTAGTIAGLTSFIDEGDRRQRQDARIVAIQNVCAVVAAAQSKIKDAPAPDAARLPVEPAKPFPVDALREALGRRAGSLNPYQLSMADFDISFITPIMIYGAQSRFEQISTRDRDATGRSADTGLSSLRPVLDFGNWSEDVAQTPPVLLVRITPRMVEGFWTKIARGAAQTQGVQLPPFKRIRTGFSRLRAFCGAVEVTPIHPLKIEHQVTGTETLYEGLAVFDPGALTPSCDSVKLMVYSEKEPQKADTRIVNARIVDQIWQDFAAYR